MSESGLKTKHVVVLNLFEKTQDVFVMLFYDLYNTRLGDISRSWIIKQMLGYFFVGVAFIHGDDICLSNFPHGLKFNLMFAGNATFW